MSMYGRRPEKFAWVGAVFGLFILFLCVFLAHGSKVLSLQVAYLSAAMIVLSSLYAVAYTTLKRRAEDEKELFEEHKSMTQHTDLFDDADDAVRLADRAIEHFSKYALPVLTIFLSLGGIIAAWIVWGYWGKLETLPVIKNTLQTASLTLIPLLSTLMAGSYYLGLSKEKGFRWLRPIGSWMAFTSFTTLLSGIAIMVRELDKNDSLRYAWVDKRLGQFALIILFVLLIEVLIGVIIEFYRPRTLGVEEKPLFESRILSVFTEPGGIAGNVAAALDYQFGFQVSENWFYRFLEKTVVPFIIISMVLLWLQTCFVRVLPEENGIRFRFGKAVSTESLTPGLYVKLPTPWERIEKFPVERVQEVDIGYIKGSDKKEGQEEPGDPELEGDKTGRVIIWSKTHNNMETNFIVASKNDDEVNFSVAEGEVKAPAPVTVNFMSSSIPLYFKVNNLYNYKYVNKDPQDTLKRIATRELVEYLAGVDFFDMLTHERAVGAKYLQDKIQAKADKLNLGIQVVFVGLQGVHPPVRVGSAFDDVVAAMEEKHELVLKAEQYSIQATAGAQGLKHSLKSDALAYKYQKENVAKAEADRFMKQLSGYNSSPHLYMLRSLLDVLESNARNTRKYIVSTDTSNKVFVIDLQKKLRPELLDIETFDNTKE